MCGVRPTHNLWGVQFEINALLEITPTYYCRYQLSMYLVQECVFFVDLLHHGRGAVRMTKSARMSPGELHLPSKQQPSPSGPYPPSDFSSLLG